MPSKLNRNLLQLARLYGIHPEYTDELGRRTLTPEKSIRHLLQLMGVWTTNEEEVRCALRHARLRTWLNMVEETLVIWRHAWPKTWTVHLPLGSRSHASLKLTWTMTDESGAKRVRRVSGNQLRLEATKRIKGIRHIRLALPFPTHLRDGYYRVHLTAELPSHQWEGTMRLIVAPERCYLPSGRISNGRSRNASPRLWGLTVQLYGLRSARNWGIGDFRDLQDLMTWAAGDLGAAFIGVNPLHALPPDDVSPYSPSSRLFHNPLYLDVESIPEFRSRPEFRRMILRPAFQTRLARLRESPTVNYEAVRSLKWPMFEKIYRVFKADHLQRRTKRGAAFRRFLQEHGVSLERFALFHAIQETMLSQRKTHAGWQKWPHALRHPDAPGVKPFQAAHEDRVTFFQYLEWQCDLQLKAVQSAAKQAGMAIGLYKDLAVGLAPNGADAWAFQDHIVQRASIGAPPDLFSPRGQNWGLTPLHPAKILADGYSLFVECFRQNMRHSGLIRIDHAMGLFRLFWVPEGKSPPEGGYVSYPANDFLGILALESHRQKVMIVGEDLGTVTPQIRSQLMEAGLLSYRLLLFEKTASGAFIPPHRYPSQTMVSVTTHDLPTLHGFWIGRDIELKEQLGLYPHKELIDRDRESRRRDRHALLSALSKEQLLSPSPRRDPDQTSDMDDALSKAVYTYLSRTPCRLVAVPLEDLLGDRETPNLPGASASAYPIWRMKAGPAGMTIENWRHLPRVHALVEAFAQRTRKRPARLHARV